MANGSTPHASEHPLTPLEAARATVRSALGMETWFMVVPIKAPGVEAARAMALGIAGRVDNLVSRAGLRDIRLEREGAQQPLFCQIETDGRFCHLHAGHRGHCAPDYGI